ncbi:hypothetical protein ACHAW5_010074 [Stephanodiscus triporus]|uniref:Uncharacterized protein n=1 Tax=Stephanodiscus triporus TaxID=2934178 RepID=A0ABD3QGW0_9STRA
MTNPFMVTSNECYGMSLTEASKRVYTSPVNGNDNAAASEERGVSQDPSKENNSTSQDMTFVYSRESDRFGEGCAFSNSLLSQVFRLKKSDSMNKRRKNSPFVQKELEQYSDPSKSSKTFSKEEVAEILSQYNHNPKVQHPLYHTTASEYGAKKPSQATFQNVRHGLSQKFSHSFNRTMFHDEGLNASITKSKIHDSLL